MTDSPATVIAGVPDLFFASKICGTAKSLGLKLVLAQTQEALMACAAEGASLVVLDLGADQLHPLDAIEQLKSDPATHDMPVVGFAPHQRADLLEAAKKAGCEQALTRGAFSNGLPQLLSGCKKDGVERLD